MLGVYFADNKIYKKNPLLNSGDLLKWITISKFQKNEAFASIFNYLLMRENLFSSNLNQTNKAIK